MAQTFYSRVPRAGGFMVSEANGFRSRAQITVSGSLGSIVTTGNITSGSNQLTALANVAGLRLGEQYSVAGTGIPAGTTFIYGGGSSATMSANATATTTGVAVTVGAVLSGKLFAGTVLGQITLGAASSAAKTGGNTGVGTFTLDATAPVQLGAKPGVYVLSVVATGRAQLKDPNGIDLGEYDYSSGGSVTVNDAIKGVLADDATTHFVAGDAFNITVAAGSGSYTAYNPAHTDGSQVPAGILWDDADSTSGPVQAAAVVRDAEVNQAEISWFLGASGAQITAGIAALAGADIIVRPTATGF